jgi:hypothetical protein
MPTVEAKMTGNQLCQSHEHNKSAYPISVKASNAAFYSGSRITVAVTVNHPFRVFKLTNGLDFTESRSNADNLSHVRIVL